MLGETLSDLRDLCDNLFAQNNNDSDNWLNFDHLFVISRGLLPVNDIPKSGHVISAAILTRCSSVSMIASANLDSASRTKLESLVDSVGSWAQRGEEEIANEVQHTSINVTNCEHLRKK